MAGVSTTLAAGPGAPGEARASLDSLIQLLDAQPMEDLRLLVSELVTNSVRHAGLSPGAAIGLDVGVSDHVVRGEVSDNGCGFEPVPFDDVPTRTSGWGLWLVDTLADRWGTIAGEGATVWFELGTRARPDASGASA